MKITIMLRYPKAEKNHWKKELIESLINKGHEVSLLFGESTYIRHLKPALKEFGLGLLKKKKSLEKSNNVNLFNYFSGKIRVEKVIDLNSPESEKIIKDINPDYLLLLGTGIIRSNILALPAERTVHCHHGHLPEYRGVSTAEWSLFHGDDVYITTHYVDPGIDTGDIIAEKKIELNPADTIDSVRRKCREESVGLILETFDLITEGKAEGRKQSPDQGRQFFFMHPFFKEIVEKKLKTS